jgi:hypothetical protein
MTSYPQSAYGNTNPNAGYPANGDFAAWGNFKWPDGVPSSLLARTNYTNQTNGQVLAVTMRKELVPLWQLAFEIADKKWKYPIYSIGPSDGKPWGPWGYANRAVSGTQRASGHSGALSVDINAPYNPYSYTFTSNMPPGMVADFESLFLFWGGRYQGQKYDAMHYGFCRKPSDVATAINKAKSILGQSSGSTPPEEPVTPQEIDAIANAVVKKMYGTAVLAFTDPATGQPVNVSFQNFLPKLGNWAAVASDNTNELTGKSK